MGTFNRSWPRWRVTEVLNSVLDGTLTVTGFSAEGATFTGDVTVTGNVTVYDATETDSLSIQMSSADAKLSSTQNIWLSPAASHIVYVYRSGQNAQFQIYAGTGGDFGQIYHDGNELFINSDTAGDDLVFQTGGSNRLRLQGTSHARFYYPISIPDGSTPPGASSGQAFLYVDSSDGSLKVKFDSGNVKTIATDT